MLDIIDALDKQLFLLLNSFHSRFFDVVMWYASDKLIWLPLYFILIYLIARKYGWETFAVLLTLAVLISLSDQVSGFIKDTVMRLRPSHEPELLDQVRNLRGYVGGNYGFVSAHAANSFAFAYFVYKFLNLRYTILGPGLFIWALIVSYSRIYLGVHYPGDIIAGAVLGLALAFLITTLYKRVINSFCNSRYC